MKLTRRNLRERLCTVSLEELVEEEFDLEMGDEELVSVWTQVRCSVRAIKSTLSVRAIGFTAEEG